MSMITHLNIEVTKRCHQRCFYCFNESNAKLDHTPYSPSQWLRVLTKLKGEGLRSVHLTGGEPFSWWGTVELLQGCQKLELKTSILSNGYRIPQLVAQHSHTFEQLDVAQISLDAMNPSVHDLRRGTRRAWTQSIQAIEALQALGVRVEISAVISDSNLEEIPSLAAYCADLGAKLLIRPLLQVGRGKAVGTVALRQVWRRCTRKDSSVSTQPLRWLFHQHRSCQFSAESNRNSTRKLQQIQLQVRFRGPVVHQLNK